MTYIIYKNEHEVNRIIADETFCQKYYNSDGYSYEEEKSEPLPQVIDIEFADPMAEAIILGVNSV